VGDPAKRRATYDDLVKVEPNLIAELVDGELVTQPRPASPHARAAFRLSTELGGPFDFGRGGPGGWVLLYEPELHLHGDVLVPDVAGWRRERMPQMPHAAAFELAPDWVCEVLSPANARIDRAVKMPIYARERVGHLWLLDPLERTLEVYRLQDGRWLLLGTWADEARVRAEPFEVHEIELGSLWAR
jgi:Uma2 family endonuclease